MSSPLPIRHVVLASILAATTAACTPSADTLKAQVLTAPGRDAVVKACALEAARRAGPRAHAIEKQVQQRGGLSDDFADAGVDLMMSVCLTVGGGGTIDDEFLPVVHDFFARPDIASKCKKYSAALAAQ